MLSRLFENRQRARKDQMEIQNLVTNYGNGVVSELERRANDEALKERDRKHWRRLLRKAGRINHSG